MDLSDSNVPVLVPVNTTRMNCLGEEAYLVAGSLKRKCWIFREKPGADQSLAAAEGRLIGDREQCEVL